MSNQIFEKMCYVRTDETLQIIKDLSKMKNPEINEEVLGMIRKAANCNDGKGLMELYNERKYPSSI